MQGGRVVLCDIPDAIPERCYTPLRLHASRVRREPDLRLHGHLQRRLVVCRAAQHHAHVPVQDLRSVTATSAAPGLKSRTPRWWRRSPQGRLSCGTGNLIRSGPALGLQPGETG